MSRHRQRKTRTILHFSGDDNALLMRAEFLRRHGYRVLVSNNGFETMELCSREPVDAVVLDLDRNRAEVALIARGVKQRRPDVPTIVLAEAPAAVDGLHELADALVPRETPPELVKSLQKMLTP
jgi:CheY-like chemotaxis protein